MAGLSSRPGALETLVWRHGEVVSLQRSLGAGGRGALGTERWRHGGDVSAAGPSGMVDAVPWEV